MGIVRGGRSRRHQPTLQPGNRVRLTWRARLEEHLGTFQAEPLEDRAADLIADRAALAGFMTLAAHARLLPERDPHGELFDAFEVTQDMLSGDMGGPALALFERDLLMELGFGLDLMTCAATGSRENLIYVSPKTGRAVCAQAGAPYRDRLLPLPGFLGAEQARATEGRIAQGANRAALADAFALTGHFLHRHVWEPRNIAPPPERERFIAHVTRPS